MAGATIAEFVKDSITISLLHLGMYIEAGVSQLCDLLGQELDAVDRVAEDDGLINLQLGEESVEAVDFLSLLDVGVKLGDAPEGEFLHQLDGIGVGNVLLAEFFNGDGEGCTEQTNLMVLVAEINKLFKDGLELGGEELIGFVHDDCSAFAQVGNLSRC